MTRTWRLELEVQFLQISSRKLYYKIIEAPISNPFLTYNNFAPRKVTFSFLNRRDFRTWFWPSGFVRVMYNKIRFCHNYSDDCGKLPHEKNLPSLGKSRGNDFLFPFQKWCLHSTFHVCSFFMFLIFKIFTRFLPIFQNSGFVRFSSFRVRFRENHVCSCSNLEFVDQSISESHVRSNRWRPFESVPVVSIITYVLY